MHLVLAALAVMSMEIFATEKKALLKSMESLNMREEGQAELTPANVPEQRSMAQAGAYQGWAGSAGPSVPYSTTFVYRSSTATG